jgi:mono/diheme cytochrome c family protein
LFSLLAAVLLALLLLGVFVLFIRFEVLPGMVMRFYSDLMSQALFLRSTRSIVLSAQTRNYRSDRKHRGAEIMRRISVGLFVLALGAGIATQVVAQQGETNYGQRMMQGHTMRGPMMQGQTAQGQTAQAGNAAEGVYQSSCATCHGKDGRGDGPAAMALNPKPRDFKDCKRMAGYSDQTLFNAIKGGGQAVGLSPMMPAWGGTLSDEQIHSLIQYVRSFCQ